MRLFSLIAIVLIIVASTIVWAGLQDSHHDFTSLNGSGEICKPCHTPPNAMTSVNEAPPWNHEVTTATFTPYKSPTMNALPGQPTGTSKLCLSCHDGTVAVDSFGDHLGTIFISDTWYTYPNDSLDSYLGTDLTGDHPISFDYNSALANSDGELYDPATTPSGLGGTITEDLLNNGRLECTSCHDPHLSRSSGCNAGSCHFGQQTLSLWKNGDALCFTCHNK